LSARWSPIDESGYSAFPQPLVTLLAAVAVLSIVGMLVLGARQRKLETRIDELNTAVRQADGRERELEATIARQHEALLDSESELDMVRLQMDSVELQLDGVDFLSRAVREELGLPPGEATWADASSEQPHGGPGADLGDDSERLSRAQVRLAAGFEELHRLLQRARARNAQAELDESTSAGGLEDQSAAPPANWPVRGPVTSPFGWREFGGRASFHTGIDIAVDYGTPVQATGNGVVVGSGWQPGYGWSVLIHHPLGYSTLYAHLSETIVEVGEAIKTGDPVGFSGSSGRSTGPHLHYEVWLDGRPLDPRGLMDGTAAR